jgi:agmatinase
VIDPLERWREFGEKPDYAGPLSFGGLPITQDPAELAGFDVAIVGAPMDDMVSNRPGTRFGPRAVRAATDGGGEPAAWHMDLGLDPFAELAVVDFGDAPVVPADGSASHAAIRDAVGSVVRAGLAPVVLGGDHSIAYPDISAVAEELDTGTLAIVQFDAHADTATDLWGVKYSHGSPFRHLVDEGIVPGDNVVQVGLRGYWPWPEEFEWMRGNGLHWYRMDEVADRGIDAIVRDVLAAVAGAEHIFLSVDVDVLDPAHAPGTGTPEPGGMTTRELLRAMRLLTCERGFAGMEVVEVSPPYDHADITATAANRVVLEALSGLALYRKGTRARPEQPAQTVRVTDEAPSRHSSADR